MAELARASHIALVGGNFSGAKELSLTLTCAGEVSPSLALRRNGGRAGDLLYVSGTLGDARLGLRQLESAKASRSRFATERQRRPTPRLALGQLALDYARAAMDISDGLARDLTELCERSGVGAQVALEQLPISSAMVAEERSPRRRAEYALQGGEDYELLLAVPPRVAARFEQQCTRRNFPVTRIGQLTTQRAVRFLWKGKSVRAPRGFDHFA
jgi:thiamine-monophosphate kinase